MVLALTGMLALAGPADARVKKRFLKSQVFTDGTLAVGQPETFSVTRMPPGAVMAVLLEPVSSTPQCGSGPFFCDPEPVSPAAGTPPFVAGADGSGVFTMVVPTSFLLEDIFNPANTKRSNFVNGQPVHLDAIGKRRSKKVKKVGFGFSRASIQGPPPGS